MEREIEKGSCPLQFEYLEFGEKPFQFIESEKKLNEVLSYCKCQIKQCIEK